jgi:hypothetical protein
MVEVVAVVGAFGRDMGVSSPLNTLGGGVQLLLEGVALEGNEETGGCCEFPRIRSQVTNASNDLVDLFRLDCIYRAADQVVGGHLGGDSTPLVPGGTIAMEEYVLGLPPSTDSVECEAYAES